MKENQWKQDTPKAQLAVIVMSLQGHFENFADGITTKENFVQRATEHFEQLNKIQSFLPDGKW